MDYTTWVVGLSIDSKIEKSKSKIIRILVNRKSKLIFDFYFFKLSLNCFFDLERGQGQKIK